MPVYTINASTNFGYVRSQASNYANARGTSGTKTAFSSTAQIIGQQLITGTNYLYESFLEFDTSGVTGTITSVELKVYLGNVVADNPFVAQARLYDFSTSVTTADWVPGADVAGDTLLATLASGAMSIGAYNSFTNVAFPANINPSGSTRFYVTTDLFAAGTAPGTNEEEIAWWQSPSQANPPQLVITTSGSISGSMSKSLSNATVSAAATLAIAGALALTAADATVTGAANLSGVADGVLSQTLADATAAGTIDVETFGYLDVTLDDATVYTEVLVDIDGEAAVTLDDAVAAGVVAWDFTGSASITLDDAVVGATTASGITGSLSATLDDATVQAGQFGPLWPAAYDFPQSPLDGTYKPTPGDDTLRTDSEVGARQYRARSGGNYADVTFALMLKSNVAKDMLDRFYRDDCANGATPFYWTDPETEAIKAWLWAAPPQIQYVAPQVWRVECALLREAA
ncbi:MAG: hypothetical protein RJA36_320 [Pseudomonadota bacterium]